MHDDHTDTSDAFVIAERLRMGRDLPPPFNPDALYLPLRVLTRYRFHLTQRLASEKAYAINLIYLKASDYTALGKQPFTDVFGATMAPRKVASKTATFVLTARKLVCLVVHLPATRQTYQPQEVRSRLSQSANANQSNT